MIPIIKIRRSSDRLIFMMGISIPEKGNSPGPVNSPHKWPVTRKMFPFDDVIMLFRILYMSNVSDNTPQNTMACNSCFLYEVISLGQRWIVASNRSPSHIIPYLYHIYLLVYLGYRKLITSHKMLRTVITYPCPRYLPLTHKWAIMRQLLSVSPLAMHHRSMGIHHPWRVPFI